MALEIVRFAPEHLEAVRAFGERAWERPSDERFARWRWLECHAHVAWLALRGPQCIAVLSAMRRRYRLGERRLEVLETFDWHTLPELVNSGLGIRVLRAAMQENTALLAIGGTATTLALLPRLGWRDQGEAERFVLPLDPRALADELGARTRLPRPLAAPLAALARRLWFRPRALSAPAGGQALLLDGAAADVAELYEGPLAQGTVQLYDAAHLAWLATGGDAVGTFVPLAYRRGGRLAGHALARIYETPDGREAAIVDAFAPSEDPVLLGWMVATMVARLAAFRPRYVRAIATWRPFAAALRRNRFVRIGTTRILFREPDGGDLVAPLHLTATVGDGPFLPYSTRPPADLPRRDG